MIVDKYYYLAVNREGDVKRLTSPSLKELSYLIKWGYKVDAYDRLKDMPVNPILSLDPYEIRETTSEKIEIQRHSAKPLKLKQAENFYISIIASIPESLGIALDTTTEIITSKLEAESDKADGIISELQAVKIGLKLQAAISEIERQGGSWYDLPSVPHIIEG